MPDENQPNKPVNEYDSELSSSESEPTTAPIEPVQNQAVQHESTVVSSQLAPKKSKKKLIIGGSLAAFLVIVLGGGALAYNVWYQNPEKVLMDGVAQLIANREDVHSTTVVQADMGEAKIKVEADMNGTKDSAGGTAKLSIDFGGEMKSIGTLSTTADFVATSDKAFFKLNKVKDTVNKVVDAYIDQVAKQYEAYGSGVSASDLEQQKQAALEQINPVIEKIDNRWVKVDLKKDEDSDTTCLTNALTKLTQDKNQLKQVEKTYNDHRFVLVKERLGSKNGSLGYKLGFDEVKANEFANSLKDTDFGKALVKCEPEAFDRTDSSTSAKDAPLKETSFEVWVSRWSHKITRVAASGSTDESGNKATFSLDTTIDYKNVQVPTVPSDAVDVNSLTKEIEGLYMNSSASSSFSTI